MLLWKDIPEAQVGWDEHPAVSTQCHALKKQAVTESVPCRVGSVGSVSASRTVGREFASRPGHTKDHHQNVTNCLPA